MPLCLKKICKLKLIWLILLFPAAFMLTYIAKSNPGFAELYAKGFYSWLSLAINKFTGLVPISLAEIFVCVFFPLAIFYIVYGILKIIKNKNARAITAAKFLLNIVCFAGVLYFVFTLNCGINYYRYTFAQTCGLNIKPSSKTELIELCSNLSSDANRLRSEVPTDSQSVMKLSQTDIYTTAAEARKSYDKLSAKYPLLRAGYSSPKPVYFSNMMSRANVTGMFFPFTFEANVNTAAPDYTIPATMCHELSHLRGYMREDEANFIGYLACEKSESADFKYSGIMLAFTYSSNALFSADSNAASKIFSTLNSGVRRDLSYNSEYWKQFEGPVASASNSVNNQYLKANSQTDGVKSYGRMVDLLLAQQRAEKSK